MIKYGFNMNTSVINYWRNKETHVRFEQKKSVSVKTNGIITKKHLPMAVHLGSTVFSSEQAHRQLSAHLGLV